MPIALYMDQHVPRAVTTALRLADIDIITAYEDGASEMSDPELLDRADERRRVLFTQGDDLLAEASKRQREEIRFRGVIYAHPLRVPIGVCVRDLEIIAKAGEPEDLMNRVQFLPL